MLLDEDRYCVCHMCLVQKHKGEWLGELFNFGSVDVGSSSQTIHTQLYVASTHNSLHGFIMDDVNSLHTVLQYTFELSSSGPTCNTNPA